MWQGSYPCLLQRTQRQASFFIPLDAEAEEVVQALGIFFRGPAKGQGQQLRSPPTSIVFVFRRKTEKEKGPPRFVQLKATICHGVGLAIGVVLDGHFGRLYKGESNQRTDVT